MSLKNREQSGFTIVELIMATAVFSVVLLLGLTGFVQIGKMFYKGVTISQTRDVSTNILQTVTSDIKLAQSVGYYPGPSNPNFICIGNHRYTVQADNMLNSGDTSDYALKRETFNSQGECMIPASLPVATNASSELLQNRMRADYFNIRQIGTNLYEVRFKVIYGEDGDIDTSDPANTICKSSSVGTQFCATSQISTIVHRGLGKLN